MKKLSTAMLFVMTLLMGVILTACGKAVIAGISIESSSIETEYLINETVDFSDIKILVRYNDDTTQEIGYNDVTLSEISTTSAGTQTLTVTYQGFTATIHIYVYATENDALEIQQYSKPSFVVAYESNIAEKTDKQLEFTDRTDGYYVGDDNAFKFLPTIRALNDNDEMVTITKYTSLSVIQELENNEFVTLTGDDLTNMVAVDEENSTYDFTAAAIGKTFKLTVRPYFYSDITPINFTFTVVDGWNAYSAADLSKLDNNSKYTVTTESGSSVINPWADYKQANGVTTEAISGLIMHNDIALTANDIPSYYIYSQTDLNNNTSLDESLLGSLKDWNSIYALHTATGTTFNFIGNYFKIDASNLPLIEMENNGEYITSDKGQNVHSTLFGFGGDDHNVNNQTTNGKIVVKNINLIGNSNREENPLLSGGLTFFRVTSEEFVMDNTIARQVLTILCPFGEWQQNATTGEWAPTTITNIIDSKGYDSFSCMFYFWGAPATFTNCEYKSAGGPIMILAHVANDDHYTYGYSSVTATNCNFESLVDGQEAWFDMNNATEMAAAISAVLSGLQQYSSYFNPDYSLIKVSGERALFNLIAIVMTGDSGTLVSSDPVNGNVSVNLDNTNDTILDMNVIKDNQYYNGGAPVFVSSVGGSAYYNGEGFAQLNDFTANGFFAGDYLSLYKDKMGVLLGMAE